MDASELNKLIAQQGDLVRSLKAAKASKDEVNKEVAKLLELKAKLTTTTDGSSEGKKFVLKTPKGMRDYAQEQMAIREKVFDQITKCFKRHGAQAIDTPVCELKETLTGKYGEDSKLIYDLQDQGGELLSLRYDLTVPFARFCAQNKISSMKRYQIGKVYRRDNPSMTKGRYREFYQCDIDIAGNSDDMLADAECAKIVTEVLGAVGINDYVIKINHRSILEGMFALCGVPGDLFKAICSSVDKLDKTPWEDVRKEMVDEKGLSAEAADKISTFITQNGSIDLVRQLLKEGELMTNVASKKGLEDVLQFLELCAVMNISSHLKFDLSLARGLDYYTGIIFEAVLTSGDSEVGSIAAGGRYDTLVGLFAESKKSQVPCVGVSIGIERIFSILEKKANDKEAKDLYPTHCLVCSAQKGLTNDRLRLLSELWASNVNAEHSFKRNPKILDQMQYCEEKGIPIALILGQDELAKNVVTMRDVVTREQIQVPREQLLPQLRKKLAKLGKPIVSESSQ